MRNNMFRSSKWAIATTVLLMAFLPRLAESQVAPDQGDLAKTLTEGSEEDRREAVAAIAAIPAELREAQVRDAVVSELVAYREELESRASDRSRSGSLVPRADHGEYLFQLLEVLIQFEDPSHIPHLSMFLGTGNAVINALASFGDRSIVTVASVVTSESLVGGEVYGGLVTLRRIWDSSDGLLSAEARRGIIEAAAVRLIGVQNVADVFGAIDLAVATGDEELMRKVVAISEAPGDVLSLRGSDEDELPLVRDRARRALIRNDAN